MATEIQTAATERTSRVGKRPVEVPAGVTVTIAGNKFAAKGPKGASERVLPDGVDVTKDGTSVVVKAKKGVLDGARLQGLTRALIKNIVEGVSKGYDQAMDLIGTGYRAEVKGQELTLALGYSHPINFTLPTEVKAKVEIIDVGGTKKPRLHLSSADKEVLGQTAARIRSFREPEPYKGKGVRYVDEKVREKAGKAGKGAGKK
jgi:large subunit ribosomal protein L6